MDIISAKNLLETSNTAKISAGGQSSSETLNQMNEHLRNDLLSLDEQISDLSTQLVDSSAIMTIQSANLASAYNTLLAAIQSTKTYMASASKQCFIDLFDSSYVFYETGNTYNTTANVNTTYGQATLGITSQSDCLVTTDTAGTINIPEQTSVTYVSGASLPTRPADSLFVEDANFVYCLDGDPGTAWCVESSSATAQDVWVKITAPIEVMSNEYANTLILHPYPTLGFDLISVSIQKQDGSWLTTFKGSETGMYALSHIPGYNQTSSHVEKLGPLRLFFPPCYVSSVYLRFNVPTSSPYWGFSAIELQMTQFDSASTLTFEISKLLNSISLSSLDVTSLNGVYSTMLAKLSRSKVTYGSRLLATFDLEQQVSGMSPVITGLTPTWS